MNSIQNIVDHKTDLGLNYFDESGTGYLRNLLRTPKSYEDIYKILSNDLSYLENPPIEEYQKQNPEKAEEQLNMLSFLYGNFNHAKKIIDKFLIKKQNQVKKFQKQLKSELRELRDDLLNGEINEEEYEEQKRMLSKLPEDDISELKNIFNNIDQEIKKKFGNIYDISPEKKGDVERLSNDIEQDYREENQEDQSFDDKYGALVNDSLNWESLKKLNIFESNINEIESLKKRIIENLKNGYKITNELIKTMNDIKICDDYDELKSIAETLEVLTEEEINDLEVRRIQRSSVENRKKLESIAKRKNPAIDTTKLTDEELLGIVNTK